MSIVGQHAWLSAGLVCTDVWRGSERASCPAEVVVLRSSVDIEVFAAREHLEVIRVTAVLQSRYVLLAEQCGEPRIFSCKDRDNRQQAAQTSADAAVESCRHSA
jgi:hypothetical protein